jgi:hypothetical protein
VVAFRRRIALYWPTKCVFRLSAANGESTPKNRADCTVQDRVGANQRLVFFLRYASPNAIYFGLSFTLRADFFLAARCFLTAALARAIAVYRKLVFF